jgi:hypothetical protein
MPGLAAETPMQKAQDLRSLAALSNQIAGSKRYLI